MLKGCSFDALEASLRGVANGGEPAMGESVTTYVTQSKYFSPVFNAAIFDGPIRIYFAQYHESQALKLYFNLNERFGDVRRASRGIFRDRARNIFVMMYPNCETFDTSFGEGFGLGNGAGAEAGTGLRPVIVREKMGSDFVIGVRGPLGDEALEGLCKELDDIVQMSEEAPIAEA